MRLWMWQHDLPADTALRRPALNAPALIHKIQIKRARPPNHPGTSSRQKLDLL
jgi:hypothetical protein